MPVHSPEYRAPAAGCLLLLAALAPAGLQAAAEAPAATDWPLLIEQIGNGELNPARRSLLDLKPADAPEADRQRRLLAVIDARQRQTQGLLKNAALALSQRRLSEAGRQVELAAWLDQSAADSPQAQEVGRALQALTKAQEALERCFQQQASACLQAALVQVRRLDRHNGTALQVELAAHDWYPGEPVRGRP